TEIVRVLRSEYSAAAGAADAAVAAAEHVLALVDDICAAGPAVLVVDDLQWADAATVSVWHRLSRSVGQLPLLLVGTIRPVLRRDDVAVLCRAVAPQALLQMEPLSEPAVAALLGTLAGAAPGPLLLRLAAGAAGNPLYLTELVGALRRGRGLAVA